MSHSDELLKPFWENVLERTTEDMQTQMVMAGHFAKINAVFLTKKPAEVDRLAVSSACRMTVRLIRVSRCSHSSSHRGPSLSV
jgi:hypothetical protein